MMDRWRSRMASARGNWLWAVARGVFVSGLLLSSMAAVDGATFQGDTDVLLALRSALGNTSILASWVAGSDPCSSNWAGVAGCAPDNATGQNRVTALYLYSLGLQGTIAPDLGNLTHLNVLDLSLNPGISGPIPQELGKLALLSELNLARCSLQGDIPSELGNLANLQFLILDDNQLSGPLPSSLGSLSGLLFIDVSNNRLSGPIPMVPGIAQLSNALHLHFFGNQFSGSVPPEFGALTKAIHLLLDDNLFTGPLPAALANMSALQVLHLNNNTLEGGIPTAYGNLTNLGVLSLHNCNLSGPVPDLSSLTGLMNLDLSGNAFSGPVPPALGMSLTLLQTVDLSHNRFSGNLGSQLLNLRFLSDFSAGNNSLMGTVPDFSQLSNLSAVSLPYNLLTGAVPSNTLNKVTLTLDLTGNPLCHYATPASRLGVVCQPTGGSNGGGGDVAVLTKWAAPPLCPNLTCPAGQAASSSEVFAQASQCVCRAPVTLGLLLQAPPFTQFTDDLGGLMRYNFHSEITPLNVSMDQVWVVSANETQARQQVVEVQFFPPAGSSGWSASDESYIATFVANHGTDMGPQFRPYSVSAIQLAPPVDPQRRHHGWSPSTGALVAIIVGACLVFIVLKTACMAYLWVKLRKRYRKELKASQSKTRAAWNGAADDMDEDLAGLKLHGVRYLPLEVLEKATDHFNNVIGEGGYGAVYKGVLESGEIVAVKRARPDSQQGARSFRSEIENLSGVRHRNLVVLLGFCKEQGEQLLVYEFVSGGNLFERLHAWKKNGQRPLTWPERVDIALGSARGIVYLHKEIYPPVIHRDIKSSNILIDDKVQPKVSDFGLSKLGVVDETAAKNGEAQPTNVKGTLGYVDPEYFMSDRLTEKSDVYSFGVVLLELLTARRPIESYEHVVRKVITTMIHHGGLLGAIVDPDLDRCSKRGLEAMLDLALRCVKNDSAHRPSMQQVVGALEAIRECAHETDFVHSAGGSSSSLDSSSMATTTGTTLTEGGAAGTAGGGGNGRAHRHSRGTSGNSDAGGSSNGPLSGGSLDPGLRRQGGGDSFSQPASAESFDEYEENQAISAVLPR